MHAIARQPLSNTAFSVFGSHGKRRPYGIISAFVTPLDQRRLPFMIAEIVASEKTESAGR